MPICNDERQFIPASGQSWTTLEGLRNAHSNKFRSLAAGLMTLETTPAFGIGQRAIFARTPDGNVLWECLALIDEATVDLLKGLGGVTAIATHPRTITPRWWSGASHSGGVPIHLHAADRQWVMRADPAEKLRRGDTKPIGPGLTLIWLGGHFDGGTVLHWGDWSKGRGASLSGQTPFEAVPSGHVSFMWSDPEPNPPLRRQGSADGADFGTLRIGRGLRPVFRPGTDRQQTAKQVVAASVARYIARISESWTK